MSKLVRMPHRNGSIIIEVETPENEIIQVSKTGEWIIANAKESFEKVENVISDGCSILSKALKNLAEKDPALESASLEFGIQFTAEGNAYVVKSAANGAIKVLVNLKLR